MNREDEIWFFLTTAISASDHGSRYYYDREDDCAFAFLTAEQQLWHRNKHWPSASSSASFSQKVNKILQKDASLIELHPLSQEEMIHFVEVYFVGKKAILISPTKPIDGYVKSLLNDLKALDSDLYLRFDLSWHEFLISKVKEQYFPSGISEITKVLW